MGQEQSQAPMTIGGHTVRVKQKLAEGGYSFVYLVEDVNTGAQYALKRCVAGDSQAARLCEMEISILKTLSATKNPNIVDFLGSVKRDSSGPGGSRSSTLEYCMLLEFCNGGSVHTEMEAFLGRGERFNEIKVFKIFVSGLRALYTMHSQKPPLAHRDIKIENLLITSNGTYKLCDFGSCTTRSKVYTVQSEMSAEQEIIERHSTPTYRAPEMCDLYRARSRQWPISEKVDVWAMGCVLYMCLYFKHPFEDGGSLGILSGRVEHPNQPHLKSFSKYPQYIMSQCFTTDPNARPSVEMLLQMCDSWKSYLQKKLHSDETLGAAVDAWTPATSVSADGTPNSIIAVAPGARRVPGATSNSNSASTSTSTSTSASASTAAASGSTSTSGSNRPKPQGATPATNVVRTPMSASARGRPAGNNSNSNASTTSASGSRAHGTANSAPSSSAEPDEAFDVDWGDEGAFESTSAAPTPSSASSSMPASSPSAPVASLNVAPVQSPGSRSRARIQTTSAQSQSHSQSSSKPPVPEFADFGVSDDWLGGGGGAAGGSSASSANGDDWGDFVSGDLFASGGGGGGGGAGGAGSVTGSTGGGRAGGNNLHTEPLSAADERKQHRTSPLDDVLGAVGVTPTSPSASSPKSLVSSLSNLSMHASAPQLPRSNSMGSNAVLPTLAESEVGSMIRNKTPALSTASNAGSRSPHSSIASPDQVSAGGHSDTGAARSAAQQRMAARQRHSSTADTAMLNHAMMTMKSGGAAPASGPGSGIGATGAQQSQTPRHASSSSLHRSDDPLGLGLALGQASLSLPSSAPQQQGGPLSGLDSIFTFTGHSADDRPRNHQQHPSGTQSTPVSPVYGMGGMSTGVNMNMGMSMGMGMGVAAPMSNNSSASSNNGQHRNTLANIDALYGASKPKSNAPDFLSGL